MENLRKKLSGIEDTRHQSYIKHKLTDILIIVMCAVLCGISELDEIVIYAKNKSVFLKENLEIELIPSKPTISRVLNMVDGEKVGEIICNVMLDVVENHSSVIAVDGKAIRSTSKKDKPHSALQILTAYATENGLVLGQQSIHEKTNEIPVFQEMLENIDVEGKIITADALHCQKETCSKITKKGGNYLFGLKENQKNLYNDVKLFIDDEINLESIETDYTLEKNGGRIEKREIFKTTDIDWISSKNEWAGLKTIFAIKRTTTTKNTTSVETSYYMCSFDETAKNLLKITREHWKIESMHWMLDVIFGEDDCEILSENGHKTLNSFRKLALLAHKKYMNSRTKKQSIKSNVFECLINDDRVLQVIKNL